MAKTAVDVRIKKATCFHCLQNCGRLVHIGPNDEVISVEVNNPNHPIQPQKLPCSKGTIVKEFHDSPRRINYPMKRVGKRGQGEWQRLTWDEAMDEIAAKLAEIRDKYGPEAVFVNGGTVHSDGDWAAMRWCNLFGTPNYIYQGKNCGSARLTTQVAAMGWTGGGGAPGKTKCVITSGVNPGESLMGWNNITNMQKQGAKLIVVDPRRTELAKLADVYIPIRPASDAALFLGMINVILNENLWDHEFVEKWVLGFDELVRVAKKYPPERAAEICWTDKDLIIQTARDFATLRPAVLNNGVATTHIGGSGSISATLAQVALVAITGNLEVEGGMSVGKPIPREAFAWHDEMHWDTLVNHPLRTRDTISADRFPVGSVKAYQLSREAMKNVHPEGYNAGIYLIGPSQSMTWKGVLDEKPYPIKAVITEGGNPLCTMGNPREIFDALMSPKLDIHVCMDLVWTPTAQLADYVLPASDWLERPCMNLWWFGNFYIGGERCKQPMYDRHDDYDLWADLGQRLGQAEYWPDTVEGMYDRFLKPSGITFEQLMKQDKHWYYPPPRPAKWYEKTGFATFSGKVELVPTLWKMLGYPPDMLDYKEPPRSPYSTPEIAEEYPFVLASGSRVRIYQHSQFKGHRRLRKLYPYPFLQIHPTDAKKLEIEDGDPVIIETPEGRIRQKAKVTEDIMPGVVHADGYWYFPELPGTLPTLYGVFDSGSHVLCSSDPDVHNTHGEGYYRGLLCKVYKAQAFR